MKQASLPGRLGDANATLERDPRADPRIAQFMQVLGGFAPGLDPIKANASYAEALSYCESFEAAAAAGHDTLRASMPTRANVASTSEVIKGVDGNDITLFIHKPTDVTGPVPCIFHTHGGGMVVMRAADPNFERLRNDIASRGVVVVGVEFRNGGGALGPHPFPAGLNDCAAGLQWVHARKAELGINKIVISGESGGGNLCIATTLKAKQEGWLQQIDGVYAMCPYISGQYANPPAELVSLAENEGYLLDGNQMAAMAKVYDPSGDNADNPLAWPLHAGAADLEGLPPHVISVNELDPLRDEGLQFYRKLLAAGVCAIGKTSLGTPHAGDQGFPEVVPEIYADLLGSIVGFAQGL